MTSEIRILAADDEPAALRIVERVLGSRYSCEFAADVSQARAKLAQGTYQLVLCDIEMPGGSGLSLAEDIVAQFPETAVVMVTGIDDPQVAEHAASVGVHGYLIKPFMPGQLLITVINALKRRELEFAQRAHEDALQQQLQTIIDRAPLHIYVKDRKLRLTAISRVASEAAGFGPRDLIGHTIDEFMPTEGRASSRASDQQVLETGRSHESEEAVTIAGEQQIFRTAKFPLLDDEGQVYAVCAISADITAERTAKRLAEELAGARQQAIEELRSSRQETIDRLAKAVELHDADTGDHINRMAALASYLSSLRGWATDKVALMRAAAPMHDVGKIGVSGEVIRKPGKLTPAERMEMERHTVLGHQLLGGSESRLLRLAATIALTHHERWDGSGYPQGLSGEEIPEAGRIVAVADALDAMLSERPYRKARSPDAAVNSIQECMGTQFDPAIVELLFGHIEEALSLRN